MGVAGRRVDQKAEDARRALACHLLAQGIPPRMVARQCGRSNSWIYQVRKEYSGSQQPSGSNG